jgi:hypothetical protein
MFEIHTINGDNCPVLVCDICGEQLTEVGKAAVVFHNFSPKDSKLKALHVHKGSIDGKTCHHEADLIIRSGGGTPGWQEMRTCLADLAHNIGFTPAAMAKFDKRRDDPMSA